MIQMDLINIVRFVILDAFLLFYYENHQFCDYKCFPAL